MTCINGTDNYSDIFVDILLTWLFVSMLSGDFLFSTPSVPNYRLFWIFRYIPFMIHLDILFVLDT